MKREEEIIDAGIEYTLSHHPVCIGGGAFADEMREFNRSAAFEAGAKWADSNPPKGTSLIKWQTGIPKTRGNYIVAFEDENGKIDVAVSMWSDRMKGFAMSRSIYRYAIAWCKLDDIEKPVL